MTPIPAGWKLISSAPKDGTTVILGRDMGAFGFIRGYGYFAGTDGAFVSGWVSKGFCEPHGNLGLANPTHWMPLPAAPGAPASVAPGDAQAVAWMNPETQDVITNERKVSWLTTYGVGMAAKAAGYSQPLGVLAAPAAGDALDAARYRWLRDADDRQRYEAKKWMAGYGPERLDATIDAALAAQQQGEA